MKDGILPGVTGAPDSATCFPGGVVDPVVEPGAESLGVCRGTHVYLWQIHFDIWQN